MGDYQLTIHCKSFCKCFCYIEHLSSVLFLMKHSSTEHNFQFYKYVTYVVLFLLINTKSKPTNYSKRNYLLFLGSSTGFFQRVFIPNLHENGTNS